MGKQNETNIKQCMLCLVPCNENFEVVDDAKRNMLEAVTLAELDLFVNKELTMCMSCARNLKKSFDFKTNCLEAEECIKLFSNESDAEPNLTEIYLNKYGKQDKPELPRDYRICRLCIELVNSGSSTPLAGDSKDALFLSLYLPELVINVTADPVICALCYTSLQEYLQFMKLCSGSVKDICSAQVVNSGTEKKLDLNFIQKNSVKCEEDCKLEMDEGCRQNDQIHEIASKSEYVLGIESEEFHIKSEPIDNELEQIGCDSVPTNFTPQSTGKTYRCKICEFKTNDKDVIERHTVAHLESTKATYHECNLCTFKTKHKYSLKRHMNNHKNAPKKDVLQYQCVVCLFKTKYKSDLRQHELIHHSMIKPKMYSCSLCDYKSKRKAYLRRHLVFHQDPSDITTRMYQCPDCEYSSKWKSSLTNHMSGDAHLKSPESWYFRCKVCGFQTLRKYHKHHMLVHQNFLGPPEVGGDDDVGVQNLPVQDKTEA